MPDVPAAVIQDSLTKTDVIFNVNVQEYVFPTAAIEAALNFAGDIDEQGRPLPMSVEVLRARTEKWPLSPCTPDGVAAQLGRARQMFIDGYYTYENFIDAATRSLQAVEAALRVRLEAGSKISFAQLIDQAKEKGLIGDSGHDILHTGRILRNQQIHATTTAVFNPAIAAGIISASHGLVAELFENRHLKGNGAAWVLRLTHVPSRRTLRKQTCVTECARNVLGCVTADPDAV